MKPNIVFITCHDLGRHLGCYGRHGIKSPALDKLARGGVVFRNAFCTSSLCSPSRAALHTGRYPHVTGVNGLTHPPFSWRFGAEEWHLARWLRAQGYQETVLLGFQHLSMQPASLGYTRCEFRIESARRLGTAAADYLYSKPAGPFYLEVGFFEAHRPFDWGGAVPDHSEGLTVLDGWEDTAEVRADFAALRGAVAALDHGVGQIMTALRATGMEENTLVVFTTDHGLPLVRAKSTLYDAGLETALIMRWPAAGLQGGDCYDGLFSNVDIVPTILEGMGLPQPTGVQGASHWPCLRGGGPMVRQHIFAEKTYHTGYEPMRAVRDERHKLIVNFEIGPAVDVPSDIIETDAFCSLRSEMIPSRKPVELYDLLHDPLERENLAENPALQGVRDNLGSILRNWMRETDDPLLHGPIASPFRQQALRALGVAG